MRYEDALAFIYSFSDFERNGVFARASGRNPEDNLRRMNVLLTEMGNPHLSYPTTHIAGTKGKGSTAVLIAGALTASGISTGLYTQPDLHTFRERIQIDNEPISEAEVAELVPIIQSALARISPTDAAQFITFEIGTALALLAFQQRGVGHAVIEVGLGGRLDPTNIIAPLVGVITSISLDHTVILGKTISAIAKEKAGIIKSGMVVVTSAESIEARSVIEAACNERDALLIKVGPEGSDADYIYPSRADEWHISDPEHMLPPPFEILSPIGVRSVQIQLLGAYQRQNAAAALAALDALRKLGIPVTDEGIAEGFLSACWPARMQVVGVTPWIVVDGAHNADSLEKLLTSLVELFRFDRCYCIFGTMRDKDIKGMLMALTHHQKSIAEVITTQIDGARAFDAVILAARCRDIVPVRAISAVGDAITAALSCAGPGDLILITGSLHLAGDALRWIVDHRTDSFARKIRINGSDHT
jgi:dihydrofolate synthase / folylpolyglutamate synthase